MLYQCASQARQTGQRYRAIARASFGSRRPVISEVRAARSRRESSSEPPIAAPRNVGTALLFDGLLSSYSQIAVSRSTCPAAGTKPLYPGAEPHRTLDASRLHMADQMQASLLIHSEED